MTDSIDNIGIIFENDDVVVINKPVGVMTHHDGHHEGVTVVDWFLEHAPESSGVGEQGVLQDGTEIDRSGIVHRLDRDTSGVLVLVKNQETYKHLKRQFHDRLVKKEYRAFVYGHMKEKWGTINRPIGRSAKDSRRRSAQRGAKGTLREAVTDWELINQVEDGSQEEKFAYLKLMPKTGRTHQIRAHLKAVDHPVVGDALYAPESFRSGSNFGIDRLALHAYSLEVELKNGEKECFTTPLPDIFKEAGKRIAQ